MMGSTNINMAMPLKQSQSKKDLTLDMLTIMSDKVNLKFKVRDGEYKKKSGRWCNICK